MKISRYYSTPERAVKYKLFKSSIKYTSGEKVFDLEVEAPAHWSETAVSIMAQKYFRHAGVPNKLKHVEDEGEDIPEIFQRSLPYASTRFGGETSAKQVFHRIAGAWTYWGIKGKYFDTFEDTNNFYNEMYSMLEQQIGSPNSPQWFNVGLYWAYGIKGPAQGHYYTDQATGETLPSTSSYERPQASACFINSVTDDLVNKGGIMDLWMREARIFKLGSGAGSNVSAIRGENEKLSGGGKSSGLMSFLKIGDTSAGSIKSGGTTRRAAKLLLLDDDHPDLEDFIDWKVLEENKVAMLVSGSNRLRHHLNKIKAVYKDSLKLKKVAKAAISDGIPALIIDRIIYQLNNDIPVEFKELTTHWESESYQTVSGQNSNNSIRVSNNFMNAVIKDLDWNLINRTDGNISKTIKARHIWNKIGIAAWSSADPGLQFKTTTNNWHTCPVAGEIRGANPCMEYNFTDDTACNLASLNLKQFVKLDGSFDFEGYRHAVRLWTLTLEITVGMSQYPSEQIAINSHNYRTLGLGFANLGGLLMSLGIPYDSVEGRFIAGGLTALMTGDAYATSAEIAKELKPFKGYEADKQNVLRVLKNHAVAAGAYSSYDLEGASLPFDWMLDASLKNHPWPLIWYAKTSWERAYSLANDYGVRNANTTLLAPTGTIGIVMDCDTTGVEPDYSLVKYKSLAGGGNITIVNQSVRPALEHLKYSPKEISDIESYILQNITIEGAPHIKEKDLPIFDCASPGGKIGKRSISVYGHLAMMAAIQPFLSGAISKTVNMPKNSTIADVQKTYIDAWMMGIKAIALYRDGSKLSQPLTSFELENLIDEGSIPTLNDQSIPLSKPARKKLPDKRSGYTQKADIAGHKLYLRTGEYEDGRIGEIFLDIHKEGASLRSMMNNFAVAVSLGLQYGVPLEEFVDAFTFTRFEPYGPVRHHEFIRNATSLLDFVFRDLAINYLKRFELGQIQPTLSDNIPTEVIIPKIEEGFTAKEAGFTGDCCTECGSYQMVRNGVCIKCLSCGTTTGCS